MRIAVSIILALAPVVAAAQSRGYFRDPVIHGDTIVFRAEGDIWRVPVTGGPAQRLTTYPEEEMSPFISPDGKHIAFSATYEGPREVYVMPIDGGTPTRLTYEAETSLPTGWTPDGRVVYQSGAYSTYPTVQLATIGTDARGFELVPLHQADEGQFADDGATVFFVRPPFHRNNTRNYQGGTARNIWRFNESEGEAVLLTGDHPGEHYNPIWSNGRLYFICERSGTRNIWSMDRDGNDKQQVTNHDGWDVHTFSIHNGRIAYRLGADIHVLDLASGADNIVQITLPSDFDQLRDNWVENPMSYLTAHYPDPEGESVVLTSRGRVFVAPVKTGRLVQAARDTGTRYRDVVFMPDGEKLIGLSDATGEFEFYLLPANGVGEPEQITNNGGILRYAPVPAPDGKHAAYTDHNNDLWLLNIEDKTQTKISQGREGVGDISWSPDSQWIAYAETAVNTYTQIFLYNIESQERVEVTSDRTNSHDPAWDPKGEFLYFLSDRDLVSIVGGPWGPRQPEPYFDQPMRIYHVALKSGLRSPFRPDDELSRAEEDKKDDEEKEEPGEEEEEEKPEPKPNEADRSGQEPEPGAETNEDEDEETSEDADKEDSDDEKDKTIEVETDGLALRVERVPVGPGNYANLTVSKSALYLTKRDTGRGADTHLAAVKISNDGPKVATIIDDFKDYEMNIKQDKILAHKGNTLYVFNANGSSPKLDESRVNLSGWAYPIDVAEDWKQIYIDAWRMQRDHFYDPNMHGLDWNAVRDKYLPLVGRVTTRDELNDVIGMAMGELSALHVSVHGGDQRSGDENVRVASLGAMITRDDAQGGYRIDNIYETDPDYPSWRSPLADPYLNIKEGDIIEAINGVKTLSVDHISSLLRNQAGRQVLIRLRTPDEEPRDAIVEPISSAYQLRYNNWKYTRRKMVEETSNGRIGYIHLSAMGSGNLSEWYREFYPVFNREGLIIDVRHNRGGNIDSILLGKLLRESWSFWKGRTGESYWNMQYAFRGHAVVLVDEHTASDGEAFAEGFRRLGMGIVIGMRTWGGQIWLSDRNRLTDHGIARSPQYGVYGPEGEWLIEGHGVDPDIVVDNLPHETFNGKDRQLQTGIDHLMKLMASDPVTVPEPPPYPDKTP